MKIGIPFQLSLVYKGGFSSTPSFASGNDQFQSTLFLNTNFVDNIYRYTRLSMEEGTG